MAHIRYEYAFRAYALVAYLSFNKDLHTVQTMFSVRIALRIFIIFAHSRNMFLARMMTLHFGPLGESMRDLHETTCDTT